MDEFRARPGDQHVEPLFAGLGVREGEEHGESARPRGRAALQAIAVLAITGGLLAWWLS